MIQYLFDYHSFLNKTIHFPPTLLFPQFFYMSVTSILMHLLGAAKRREIDGKKGLEPIFHVRYERDADIERVIRSYYEHLQNVVDLVFVGRTIRLMSPTEIKDIIYAYIRDLSKAQPDLYHLESYIKDENSRLNYQEQLFRDSQRVYGKDTVDEIVSYLCAHGCCKKDVIDDDGPPHSKHYVTIGTNCTLAEKCNGSYGPEIWGPFYWGIFHALPTNYPEDKFLCTLQAFFKILPVIIPCEMCRDHYYTFVRPGEIKDPQTQEEAKVLYTFIHNTVTKNKYL